MTLVIATAKRHPLNGIFWYSYFEAEGPMPDQVFSISDGSDGLSVDRIAQPFLLFRIRDIVSLAASRLLGVRVIRSEQPAGLSLALTDVFPEDLITPVPSLNEGPGMTEFKRLSPDVLVSVGSPEIFSEEILSTVNQASLNIHNGKLPQYRGQFGTFWEMYHGEVEGAVSIHRMIPTVDAGEVLATATVDLDAPLYKVLLQKKKRGGQLLAGLLNDKCWLAAEAGDKRSESVNSESGRVRPSSVREESSYYSWPTLREQIEFCRRRKGG